MRNIISIGTFAVLAASERATEGAAKNEAHRHHIPFDRSPLNCTCPETYEFIDERCERTIAFPLEELCPPGFVLSDGVCLKQVYPKERCPYGYARVRDECVRREVTIPELACQGNYTLEPTNNMFHKGESVVCVAQIPVDPIPQCPDGSVYQGVCYDKTTTPAEYTCPEGYAPGPDNTCTRNERVECAQAKEHTGILGLLNHVNAPRRLLRGIDATYAGWNRDVANAAANGGPRDWKPWRGDLLKLDVVRPVIDIEANCYANVTIAATPFCPTGTQRGRVCVVPNEVPPNTICPAFGTPDNCFAFDRIPPRTVCPDGFTRECAVQDIVGAPHASYQNIECDCVQLTTQPVDIICPPNSVLEGDICSITSTPYTGCPLTAMQMNGQCQRKDYAPAVCTYTVAFACHGNHCKSKDHVMQAKLNNPNEDRFKIVSHM